MNSSAPDNNKNDTGQVDGSIPNQNTVLGSSAGGTSQSSAAQASTDKSDKSGSVGISNPATSNAGVGTGSGDTPMYSSTEFGADKKQEKGGRKPLIFTILVILLIVLVLPIFVVGGGIYLAAANAGQNNAISRLNTIVPVERIPFANVIMPADEEVVKEAILKDLEMAKKVMLNEAELPNSYGSKMNAVINTDMTFLGQDIVLDLNLDQETYALPKENKQASKAEISGMVEWGINKTDLNENKIVVESFNTDEDTYFYKFDVSSKILDYIFINKAFEENFVEITGENPNDFFSKYLKINSEELESELESFEEDAENLRDNYDGISDSAVVASPTTTLDFLLNSFTGSGNAIEQDKVVQEINAIIAESLYDDVVDIYTANFLDNLDEIANVEQTGREEIEGKQTLVYEFTLNEEKFGDSIIKSTEEIKDLIIRKENSISSICQKTYELQGIPEGDDNQYSQKSVPELCEIDIEAIEKSYEEGREDYENFVRDALKYTDIDNLKFFIDPVDYSLLKATMNIGASEEGLNALNDELAPQTREERRQELEDLDVYTEERIEEILDFDEQYQIQDSVVNSTSIQLSIQTMLDPDITIEEPNEYTDLTEVTKKAVEKGLEEYEKRLEKAEDNQVDFDFDTNFDIDTSSNNSFNQRVYSFRIDNEDKIIWGSEDTAQGVIVEFSDYECPFCKRFREETYQQLQQEYVQSGKMQYAYMDMPLNFHETAEEKAIAGKCMNKLDGNLENFKTFQDKMFADQEPKTNGELAEIAKQAGYQDEAKFMECLEDESVSEELAIQMQKYPGAISGTPAFIIARESDVERLTGGSLRVSGIVISGAYPYSEFQETIDDYLQ